MKKMRGKGKREHSGKVEKGSSKHETGKIRDIEKVREVRTH